MAITIQCRCGKSFAVDEKHRGKRGRCPGCGHVQLVIDDRYPPAAAIVADIAMDAQVVTDDRHPPAASDRKEPPPPPPHQQPRSTYQVFLSHAAEDHAVARAICDALEAEGIRCWIAPRDIMPGKDWAEVIADAVDQCRGLVLIYSPHSNASVHVRREVERAVGSGAFIIPLRIADVPMSKALGYFLHSCQWMDAHQGPIDRHLPALVASARTLLQKDSPTAATARLALETVPRRPARRMQRIAIIAAAVLLGIGLMGTIAVAAWRMNNRPRVAQQNPNMQTNALGLPAPDKAPQAGGGSPGSGARAKPLEAGFSDVMLRGGPLTVRSDAISMGMALPAPPATPSAGPPPRQRVVAISDRSHTPLSDFDSTQHAIMTVQLHNQSAEKVILSQAEFVLLGTVRLLEDVIPAPQPPTSLETPKNLVVEPSDSRFRLNYADLTKLFKDVNDPPSPLTYDVNADVQGLVTPRLDEAGRLHLAFASDQRGTAYVTLTARNAFDLASSVGFQVEVKKPVTDAAAITAEQIFGSLNRQASELVELGSAVNSVAENEGTTVKIEPKRTDLGRVLIDLSLKGNEVVAPISSGNLLPEAETTILEPNSVRSLNLRVASRTAFDLPSGSKELLSGPGGRRLSMQPPKLERAFQVGVIRLRITSESGSACDLFADKFYLMWTDGFADTSAAGQQRQVNFLSYVVEAAPDAILSDVLAAGLRTGGETVSFLRAGDCGLAPTRADEVSEHCLFGAPQHPWRTAGSQGSASGGQHQRSTLLPTLALIRQNQPAAWRQMQKQLTTLETSEGPIASKANYVKAGLAKEGPQPSVHRASVRVLAQ